MSHNAKIKTFIFVVTSIFSVSAMASDAGNPILSANNEVGIAAVGTLMNYQEHLPSPSDTESGWMPGFEVKYSLMGDYFKDFLSNMYFAVHYQYNSSSISYKGALQTRKGDIPYDSSDNATTNRVLARIGKGFSISNDMMITPYVAGGYQDWNRNLKGIGGYTEDYHSGLVGAGVMFQYAATEHLVFTANAEGLAMVGGGMTPHNVPNYGNTLGSASFGTSGQEKIAADVDYRISGPWHLYGGLNFTHFNYTGGLLNQIVAPGSREPLSSTNLFSMDAGIGYQF